jgi:general secretion pathway protein J
MARSARRVRCVGFTLAEVLVALFIMSLLAILSWRALDGMSQLQDRVFKHNDQTLSLQAGIQQWQHDLDAVQETDLYSAIDFNGRLLRITRAAPQTDPNRAGQLQLVAWTLRSTDAVLSWQRWASQPLRTRAELRQAWQDADQWSSATAQTAQATQTSSADAGPASQHRPSSARIVAATHWEIFYYRGNAWTHPQSAAGSNSSSADDASSSTSVNTQLQAIPDGVRLLLTLAENGSGLQGLITSDWVRPTVSPSL